MNIFKKITLLFLTTFLVSNIVWSQNKIATLLPPPHHVSIDGNCSEWGDSLQYYNKESKINYTISNTHDTLYLALRAINRLAQIRILRAGLTFSIDTKGKKKETFSITFPLNTQTSTQKFDFHKEDYTEVSKQDKDELMRQRLTSLRGIMVTGFKDVEDEMITTDNSYGFKAAVNYDRNDYLVCEAAIPINLFHADDIYKNEWAFNIRINGITKPASHTEHAENQQGEGGKRNGRGGGSNGRGGGGGNHEGSKNGGTGTDFDKTDNALSKTEDFWDKFHLAN